jgi:polysaccharide export outer membrane protein
VITTLRKKGAAALLALLLCGCGSSSDSTLHSSNSSLPPSAASQGGIETPATGVTAAAAPLALLWNERSAKVADFPIGPGDLLEVSVPGIDQLQDRTARVGGDGHIYLPLAGDVPVAGETEKAIREQLNQRMDKYLYHPQTNLFVKSYASRQVAVMGAVGRPGMYVLNGPEDTVRDLLERAGGIDDHGAREIVLTPAEPGRRIPLSSAPGLAERGAADDASSDIPVNHPASDGQVDAQIGDTPDFRPISNPALPARNAGSVVINLATGSDEARYADLPVRPGDTLYIPTAGSVTVVGWVYTPKTIAITPGLTVLGAVSAAGGALFAGDTKAIKLIRQKAGGQSETISVNLDEVQKDAASNTLVEANDIVEVPYSTIRLPGYAVYYAMLGIFQWAPASIVTGGM